MVRRCSCSKNLLNEEAIARVAAAPKRQKKKGGGSSFTYKLFPSYPRINLTVHSVKNALNIEHSLVNVVHLHKAESLLHVTPNLV